MKALTEVVLVGGAVFGGLCVLNLLAFLAGHLRHRRDRGGDPSAGVVIYVEPLRFAGVRWGGRSIPAGLRRAGFAGEFLYWKWHDGLAGTLLLPVLRDARRMERQARRLADWIQRRQRARPDVPVYLLGYSAGGYVAARALELLPEGVQVEAAALLSSSFSPWRDLSAAARGVRGRLLVSASLADFWVGGLGTLLFGNADGRHTPAIGMLGYLGPAHPKVVQRHWRPRMVLHGLLGMHDWSMKATFVARYVAEALGLGGACRA